MTRSEILSLAEEYVTKDRNTTHGEPEQSFEMLSNLWSCILETHITPQQVALMMVVLKVTRAWNNPSHSDTWVDIAGYAACGGELSA